MWKTVSLITQSSLEYHLPWDLTKVIVSVWVSSSSSAEWKDWNRWSLKILGRASSHSSQNRKDGTVWLWANDLNTQSLYFLICEIGTLWVSRAVMRIQSLTLRASETQLRGQCYPPRVWHRWPWSKHHVWCSHCVATGSVVSLEHQDTRSIPGPPL